MKGLNSLWLIHWALLLALFFSAPDYSFGQSVTGLNPQKRPSQYILKSWDTEDGLTSESTNDLIQTPDGYIWIGTYTGLHRFDGKEFKVFNSLNSPLPTSNVLSMDLDSKGTLWLGTLHGIATYSHGEITIPTRFKESSGYSTETLIVTSSDEIWFSTKSNQLFHFSGDTLIDLTRSLDVEHTTIQSIAETEDGTIFFGTSDSQLLRYANGRITKYDLGESTNGVNKLIPVGNTLYIGTGQGLYTLEAGRLSKKPYLEHTAIMSLLVDPEGILWLGTMKGLYRYEPATALLDSINEESGLPNNIIRDLILDNRGNLWGGTYRSGMFYLFDGTITSYSKNDGLHTDVITGVTELSKGKYLLGNENGKLNLLTDGRILDYTPELPLPGARLKHMFTDNEGRVWVSTYAGLFLLDGKRSRSYTTDKGFPDNFIRLVFQDRDDNLWVGTKNAGLIKFKTLDTWEQITIEQGLTSDYIMDISQNEKGDLIVNTISGINIITDMKVVRKITIDDGLPSNFSFSSFPTSTYFWVASNDGLIGVSETDVKVFNSENGLPFNIVYDVMGDNQGNLWMPGEKAILKVKIADLEAASDPTDRVPVEIFDKANGMKNSHCLGGVLSFTDSQASFWMPTLGGIVNLKPAEIQTLDFYGNTIIEGLYADNKLVPFNGTMVVPAQTNRLNIEFTGINYQQSEKLQFRYMLKPFDDHWIQAVGERNAPYTNLPPGNYEFVLQAGIDNTYFNPASRVEIRILAAWWQTIWAQILYVLFAILIGFLIYWLRLRSLTSRNLWLTTMVKSRTEELEHQKAELTDTLKKLSEAQEQVLQSEKMASLGVLSAGVAHEINNPLNFIKSGSHLLQKILKDHLESDALPPQDTQDVRMLLDNISMGSDRIKQIVSSLSMFSRGNPEEFKSCNLEDLINNCLTILHHEYKNHVTITLNYSRPDIHIWGNEGKLYQVFTNLILNGIQAIRDQGELSISAGVESEMARIRIKDNGVGIPKELLGKIFDPFFTTKAAGKGTGLGLSIIYTIIKEHKGEITVVSEPKKGTEVQLLLPISQNQPAE